MSKIKPIVAAAMLSALAVAAQARTVLSDSELSEVLGQDGVTIAGDLKIKIGAFTWTDTDLNGGSVSFNNIAIAGMFVQTIDVIDADSIITATIQSMRSYLSPIGLGATATSEAYKLITSGVYDGEGDVVQFAFPNVGVTSSVTPTITIGSITNGNSTASYGSLIIKNLDMQGTKIWLWAH